MRVARSPFGLIVVATSLVLASCKSSTDTDNNNGNNDRIVTATVDGSVFTTTVVIAVNVNNQISITARDAQNREITLEIADATQATAYPIGPDQPNNARFNAGNDAWVGHRTNAQGAITLSSVTATRAIGAFTLVLVPQTTGATGTRTIVGTFDVTFQTQT